MRKIISFIAFLSFVLLANAQMSSDLVVFSPFNEKFTVVIDNGKVNSYPANKIRVNDINFGSHFLEIYLADNSGIVIRQNVIIPNNTELAVKVMRGQQGQYYLDVFTAIDYSSLTTNNDIVPIPPQPQPVDNHTGFCDVPMSNRAFASALQTVKNKSFDDDKLTIAKQIALSNCLLTEQVKKLALQFSFEDNKLEFAKFAYIHTYDPENYFKLNDIFNFSSNIEELNDYIVSLR